MPYRRYFRGLIADEAFGLRLSDTDHPPILFLCLCRFGRVRFSTLGNSAGRACASAGTALDAGIRIDYVLSVSLGDRAYGALSLAGSAAYTRVADYICHVFILLLIMIS